MRVLVFTDSHGRISPMVDAVEIYKPDVVFHLGDMARDGDNLRLACPELDIRQVLGNCDWNRDDYPLESVARLAGKTVFYLHGHTTGVKSGVGKTVDKAQAIGADILLFGHTHRPLYTRYDELLVINPGALQDGHSAFLTWEEGGEVTYFPVST